MFGLQNIISPKHSFTMIKWKIGQTLNQKIKDYDLIYKGNENKIDFKIYNYLNQNNEREKSRIFKYDEGEELCYAIKSAVAEKIPPDTIVDYVIIKYRDDEPGLECDIYYKEGDKKIHLTEIL